MTGTVAPIRAETQQKIDIERAAMANLPTSRLNTMIADAHQSIALLDENEETLRAGFKVTITAAQERIDARVEMIDADIAELRKRVDALTDERVRLFRELGASMEKAKADMETQLAAIARMRDAQRAVVASLAIDVTPAKTETPLADQVLATKRKTKTA